jgi:hypothetical protein
LIEHKEANVICEESGPISLSYNVLLTTPKANIITKLAIPIVTTKSTSTYTDCGKMGHTFEIVIIGKRGTNSTNHHSQNYKTCSRDKNTTCCYPYLTTIDLTSC